MTLAFGFHDLEQQASQRIQQIGTAETNERIQRWQAELNRTYDYIFSTFVQRNEEWNTMPIYRYNQPGASRAQFVGEHGVAKPRAEEGYSQIGLPLWRYEDAFGWSIEAQAKRTVEELSRELLRIERSDMQTSKDLFWFAIFNDDNWTFASTEDNLPDIPVKCLANTDGTLYILRGQSAPAEAQHYTGQAGVISDTADPFPAIHTLLTKYAGTSASDRIVTFVGDATNVANIKGLAGFHRVERTKFTRWGDDVSLVDPNADTYVGMGDEVLGEHEEGVLVIRDQSIPTDFLVSFNLDAPPAIGAREDSEPSLRGLFPINAVENSGNLLLSRFRRKIGFAPVNRTGAAVHKINDATYDPPTQYQVIPG